jgi:hypothetical protein
MEFGGDEKNIYLTLKEKEKKIVHYIKLFLNMEFLILKLKF